MAGARAGQGIFRHRSGNNTFRVWDENALPERPYRNNSSEISGFKKYPPDEFGVLQGTLILYR